VAAVKILWYKAAADYGGYGGRKPGGGLFGYGGN
jgi:hypothetical protein